MAYGRPYAPVAMTCLNIAAQNADSTPPLTLILTPHLSISLEHNPRWQWRSDDGGAWGGGAEGRQWNRPQVRGGRAPAQGSTDGGERRKVMFCPS